MSSPSPDTPTSKSKNKKRENPPQPPPPPPPPAPAAAAAGRSTSAKAGTPKLTNAPPPPPSSNSWADRLRGGPAPVTSPNSSASPPSSTSKPQPSSSPPSNERSKHRKSGIPIEQFVSQNQSRMHKAMNNASRALIQPRGLINTANNCFMNSVLQSLVYCPPFYNFMSIFTEEKLAMDHYPVLSKCIRFMKEFEKMKDYSSNGITVGNPFNAGFMFDIFSSASQGASTSMLKGRQEDAQEFLTFFLDRLHEEFVAIDSAGKKPTSIPHEINSTANEDEWEQIGKHNRSHILREYAGPSSIITLIFGGHLSSMIEKKGVKGSRTMQPFTTLPLEIDHPRVRHIEDALKLISSPENLDGLCDPTRGQIRASRHITIESAPRVLIMQLKRFTFLEGRPAKIDKFVEFNPTLVLRPYILPATPSLPQNDPSRTFDLTAVVVHHGTEASGGHYTTLARCSSNPEEWLFLDDSKVSLANVSFVLSQPAYLLFYLQRTPSKTPRR